jgi:hypothetical protein
MGSQQDLDEFIQRLQEDTDELPSDVEPRNVTISIGGNNHGSISTGPQFTVNLNHQPGGWSQYSSDELRRRLARLQRERRDSALALIMNKQIATLLAVVTAFFLVSSDRFLAAIGIDPSPGPASVVGFLLLAAALAVAATWANSVLRVEQRVLQENGADIDAIRAVLLIRKRQGKGD